jgi:hypothetical protein
MEEFILAGEEDYGDFSLYQCDRRNIFCKSIYLDFKTDQEPGFGSLGFDAAKNQVIVRIGETEQFIQE